MTTIYLDKLSDPWLDLNRMNSALARRHTGSLCEYPAVNVLIQDATAIVTAELPGIERDAFDIAVSGDTLTLRGKRPQVSIKEGETYHRNELRHGEFRKSIRLPLTIDAEKVHASYRKGILTISLPQIESEKPRTIKINGS